MNKGGNILSKKIWKSNTSNTKKTANNNVSNNKIIITNDLTFSEIEFQLDNSAIGISIVVKITKYIDIPSTPR